MRVSGVAWKDVLRELDLLSELNVSCLCWDIGSANMILRLRNL